MTSSGSQLPETTAVQALDQSLSAMRWVELSHLLRESMPVYPGHPQFALMPWHAGGDVHMNQLLVGEHMGTHLDSPSHIYGDPGDPRHLPVDQIPPRSLAGAAVKLDLTGLEGGAVIGAEEIRAWETAHHSIAPGTIVIFQFGWPAKWHSLADAEYVASWPGISGEAAAYLLMRGIRLAGTDCLGIDSSSAEGLPVHAALLADGVPIIENLANLDDVPAEFIFMAFPLRIEGGTGSPVRAVALVP